jgi:hypothetical protein
MSIMQRFLITIGAALLLVGLVWPWLSRLGLGRLPGDIRIETDRGGFYFPITTCVIISVACSIVVWLFRRQSGRIPSQIDSPDVTTRDCNAAGTAVRVGSVGGGSRPLCEVSSYEQFRGRVGREAARILAL